MRLTGKKILITQSDAYMGPAIQAFFEDEGAELTAAPGLVPFGDGFNGYPPLDQPFDVVIANLAHDPMNGPLDQLKDDSWQALFDTMVHPLMGLVRHFAPRMADQGGGKIVAVTSAAPLRGIPGSAAYYCS